MKTMSIMRDMALIAMGSAATLAFQKYREPVKCAVNTAFKETQKKANQALDEMM